MNFEGFNEAFGRGETRQSAWDACERADWMAGAALFYVVRHNAHRRALLNVVAAWMVNEAKGQSFQLNTMPAQLAEVIDQGEGVDDLNGLSHTLSLGMSEAILDDRPHHGAMADALNKFVCCLQLLAEPDLHATEAGNYLCESVECLAMSIALKDDCEDPTAPLSELALRFRRDWTLPT